MTTTLEAPPALTHQRAADQLRRFAAAMRLSFTWFGVRKSLTSQQKELTPRVLCTSAYERIGDDIVTC